MTATYADNLFLPFALLLAKTFLPLAVLILFLKPWTLDLCLFFGWNVIFIIQAPPYYFYFDIYYNPFLCHKNTTPII